MGLSSFKKENQYQPILTYIHDQPAIYNHIQSSNHWDRIPLCPLLYPCKLRNKSLPNLQTLCPNICRRSTQNPEGSLTTVTLEVPNWHKSRRGNKPSLFLINNPRYTDSQTNKQTINVGHPKNSPPKHLVKSATFGSPQHSDSLEYYLEIPCLDASQTRASKVSQ